MSLDKEDTIEFWNAYTSGS